MAPKDASDPQKAVALKVDEPTPASRTTDAVDCPDGATATAASDTASNKNDGEDIPTDAVDSSQVGASGSSTEVSLTTFAGPRYRIDGATELMQTINIGATRSNRDDFLRHALTIIDKLIDGDPAYAQVHGDQALQLVLSGSRVVSGTEAAQAVKEFKVRLVGDRLP